MDQREREIDKRSEKSSTIATVSSQAVSSRINHPEPTYPSRPLHLFRCLGGLRGHSIIFRAL